MSEEKEVEVYIEEEEEDEEEDEEEEEDEKRFSVFNLGLNLQGMKRLYTLPDDLIYNSDLRFLCEL